MAWIVKTALALCMLLSVSGLIAPAPAAANGELVNVTVTVKIERPDYFWQYPFLGKQLDRISLSSFGKTHVISAAADTETFEVAVPIDYHLRVNISLQNGGSTVQSLAYVSKEAIHKSDKNFTIILKAPDPQPVTVTAADFDLARR